MNREWVEKKLETAFESDIFECSKIPAIFNQQDFSKLLDMIDQLDDQDRDVIYSKHKRFNKLPTLSDPKLNENGLHVFRMLLANLIYYDNLQEKEDFKENGYLVIPNFLDEKVFRRMKKLSGQAIHKAGDIFLGKKYWIDLVPEDELLYQFFDLPQCQELFKIVNATNEYEFHAKRVERLVHKTNDLQKQIHEDTFHPTIKFWYFFDDVSVQSGPTFYSKGSSVPNLERFKWEYEMSLKAAQSSCKGTSEGSFRLESEEQLTKMGYGKMEPVVCQKNSLVVFNTMGFHRRGPAPDGTIRDSVMGIFRMDPFTL